MVCEKRGPEWIFFRYQNVEKLSLFVRLTVECGACGNRETVFDKRSTDEITAMAAEGKQLDLNHLKKFTVC